MDTTTLVIAALVTARLTLVITTDRITEAPRNWLLSRLDPDSLMAYLVECNWCVSFYVGLGVAGGGVVAGWWPWPWLVPLGLAFSMVAGLLASREGE